MNNDEIFSTYFRQISWKGFITSMIRMWCKKENGDIENCPKDVDAAKDEKKKLCQK